MMNLTRVARPLLTYRDEATGEQTDLTAEEFGGWVARTASMLRDGCGLKLGDRAAVMLPPHWQTATVLLAAWSIGVSVSYRSWAVAGLERSGHGEREPFDAVFVTPERERSWLETVPEGRHRFVVDSDFMAEVSRFSDAAPEYRSVPQTGPATPDGTSYAEWAKVANALAGKLDLRSGDRVLVDPGKHGEPVMWLLAPLSAGASIVMWANADPGTLDERIAAEGITRVL